MGQNHQLSWTGRNSSAACNLGHAGSALLSRPSQGRKGPGAAPMAALSSDLFRHGGGWGLDSGLTGLEPRRGCKCQELWSKDDILIPNGFPRSPCHSWELIANKRAVCEWQRSVHTHSHTRLHSHAPRPPGFGLCVMVPVSKASVYHRRTSSSSVLLLSSVTTECNSRGWRTPRVPSRHGSTGELPSSASTSSSDQDGEAELGRHGLPFVCSLLVERGQQAQG